MSKFIYNILFSFVDDFLPNIITLPLPLKPLDMLPSWWY